MAGSQLIIMDHSDLLSPLRLESVSGLGDLDDFLVKSRSGRTKEVNESSGIRTETIRPCVDICPSEAPLVSPGH